jgi:hypothetical protein
MIPDPAVEALGRSWKEVQAAAEEYRDAAEAEVVRWAWGPRFAGWARLEPLFVLRAHGSRASTRELPEPEDHTTRELFGFDQANRVVVARSFQNWPTIGVREEMLLVQGAGGLVQLSLRRWDEQFELTGVGVPQFENGRIATMHWHRFDPRDGFQWRRERFAYDGERLVTVDFDSSDPDRDPVRQEVVWDPDGEIGRVLVHVGDRRSTGYMRPPQGGIAPVRRRVEAGLVERIAAWVIRRAPEEAVWALAILYDAEGNPVLPPSLGLAVDADRDDDPDVQFNPAEWDLMDAEPDELGDAAFAEDCQLLNQHWDATGSYTAGRGLLLRVAGELADRDWSAVLKPTADFEVFATDLELEDLARNRRKLRRRR